MGCSVTTASRKMIVRPASKILSAISLGVFCRSAPSTSLIMRSRNVSPGFDVIRTLISSESTRVPPVTAERSPPDSRITGRGFAGDGGFVDRGDAFNYLAVAGDEFAGHNPHDIARAQLRAGHLFDRAVLA